MRLEQNLFPLLPKIKKSILIIFSLIFFSFPVLSQDVDPTFNPVPSQFTNANLIDLTVQPDGKILIYGHFQIVQGVVRPNIARLNSDGSLDSSFNCSTCNFWIGSAVVQPDGKIIVAGAFAIGSGSGYRLRRLNADGSLDSSFTSPFSETPTAWTPSMTIWAIQPDGKLYASRNTQPPGGPEVFLYRLNPNGSIDNSFATLTFAYPFGRRHLLTDLKVLPDGKVMIAGAHYFGFLFRVNADGSHDTSFQSPALTINFFDVPVYVLSFDIQADGKIPLMGNFSTINGVSKSGFARLNADQSLDSAYSFPLPPGSGASTSQRLELLSDDKLLVSSAISNGKKIVRLNTDGSLDNSFDSPSTFRTINRWRADAAGRVLLTAEIQSGAPQLLRLNADGTTDTTFNVSFGAAEVVHGSLVLPDGKILFTGYFSMVNNVVRQSIARLNPDGTVDTSYNPGGTGFGGRVFKLVPQADGKIIAVGEFSSYNGMPRNRFARLNADGTLDDAFNPAFTDGDIVAAAVQADGKILIGGAFSTVGGVERKGIARLNQDGSLDESFNPILPDNPPVVRVFLVQEDGKIMFGGSFTGVNGVARSNLARLNSNGTLDESFNAGSISGSIYHLVRQPGGKYVAADRRNITRRNADGSVDSSFQAPTLQIDLGITALVTLPDNSLVIGGAFSFVNNTPRSNIARINANGSLDSNFLPQGADAIVWTLSKQSNNKIIVGGEFKYVGGVPRFGIARLNSPVVTGKTPFDYDGDGKSDVSVFRPSENKWYILQSSNNAVVEKVFAVAGDVPVPSDYDGDSKTDVAVFRPSTGDWWYQSSINNAQIPIHWGQAGDIPRPSDFDSDGKTDFIVYRPSNSVWYRFGSTGATSIIAFGIAEDKPLVGDFDGDGKSDPAVFRPSTGDWWYAASASGGQHAVVHWGQAGDIPVPGDYDADGKTDFVVYRPSNGGWYILRSGEQNYTILQFGTAEDKPVGADYDGDGKADVAVWRPSNGTWYLLQTTAGFGAVQWGASGDVPTENAFLP